MINEARIDNAVSFAPGEPIQEWMPGADLERAVTAVSLPDNNSAPEFNENYAVDRGLGLTPDDHFRSLVRRHELLATYESGLSAATSERADRPKIRRRAQWRGRNESAQFNARGQHRPCNRCRKFFTTRRCFRRPPTAASVLE